MLCELFAGKRERQGMFCDRSIEASTRGFLVSWTFIDHYHWYVCCVILLLLFVQRVSEHPLPRSLPESKLNDLVQKTDYRNFYDGIFRNVLRVRVPGTKGHHKVKMVRNITVIPNVFPLLVQVNKLVSYFQCYFEVTSFFRFVKTIKTHDFNFNFMWRYILTIGKSYSFHD